MGFEDDVLGVAEIELSTAQIIQEPRVAHQMSIKLMPGDYLDTKKREVITSAYI